MAEIADMGQRLSKDGQTPKGMRHVIDAWDCFIFEESCELTLKGAALDCYSVEYLMSHWEALRRCGNVGTNRLRSVNLIECCFADEYAVIAMVRFLKSIGKDLKRLCLEFGGPRQPVQLNQLSISALLHNLRNIHSLESLRFRDMEMGGRRRLKGLLANPGCNIRELEFHDCHLGSEQIQGLADGLESLAPGLEVFYMTEPARPYDFSGMDPGPERVPLSKLVRAITTSPTRDTLKSLRLPKFQCIRKSWLPIFASFLISCPLLEEFDLYWCRRLLSDVKPNDPLYLAFVEAIRLSKNLRSINLSMCGMINSLAVPFFQSLEGNSTIRELRLGIMVHFHTDRLSDSLANSLPKIPGLELLHANINIGCPSVKKALRTNTTLIDIDYYDDEEIRQLLCRNRSIAKVRRCLEKRDKLSSFTWPLFMEELNDNSAMYAILSACTNEMVSVHHGNIKKRSAI